MARCLFYEFVCVVCWDENDLLCLLVGCLNLSMLSIVDYTLFSFVFSGLSFQKELVFCSVLLCSPIYLTYSSS